MQFNSLSSIGLLIFLSFTITTGIYAQGEQERQREIGDVTKEDFSQYDQSYDSTAPAIVFFDNGFVRFDSQNYVILEHHIRLKILNESGLEYGDIQLTFNEEIEQEIYDIKAYSYSLQDDEVIKREVTGRDILEEKLVNDIYAKKFTMPNIEAGSIIEYSYKKIMGNPFQMPDWKFHWEIPVEYSSIYMRIPWRFNYHMVFKGTDKEFQTENGEYDDGTGEGYFVSVSKSDLPPIEDLPLIESRDNFISELYTQLNYVYRNDGYKRELLKDWKQIAEEIRMHSEIGRQRSNRDIKNKVTELITGAETDSEKAKRIFEFVSESIVWDGSHRVYAENGIRDTFKDKTGSSGDVNLLLHKMLDEAGIPVSFGLTSTRSHGTVLPDYPIVNQFNHFVTIAEIEGKIYILDATEGNRAFDLPPVKDLYQLVYVVQDDNFGWIETLPNKNSVVDITLNYEIDESGLLFGDVKHTAIGYSAQRLREQFKDADYSKSSKKYFEGYEDVEIDTVIISGLDISSNYTSHYAEFSLKAFNGDSLREVNYLTPMLFLADDKNLLERPVRKFPVYFSYPLQEIKRVNIKLPKDYIVEEVPEAGMILLPQNNGSLNFQVSSTDSTVNITSNLSIGSMFYTVEEYSDLRNMFIKLAESHSSPIVIKRRIPE